MENIENIENIEPSHKVVRKSLFILIQEHLAYMEEIENSDGEVTEEMSINLDMNEEDVKIKMQGYVEVYNMFKGQVNVLEQSIAKQLKRKSSIEKMMEKLKASMLQATLLFGDTGKSGNKVLDLLTSRLYTKNSKSTFIPDNFNNPNYMITNLGIKDEATILNEDIINKIKEFLNSPITISSSADKKKVKNDLELNTYKISNLEPCSIILGDDVKFTGTYLECVEALTKSPFIELDEETKNYLYIQPNNEMPKIVTNTSLIGL